MAASYLPLTDSGLDDWAKNFATQITSALDPVAVGLTLDEASAYAGLQGDYAAKLLASVEPGTRGPATVLAKNLAKKALIAQSRKLAMAATNHVGTTDVQRQALGLKIKALDPAPVPVPEFAPQLDVVSVQGRRVALRLRNSVNGERRKPAGVQGATLVSYVGDSLPERIRDWSFEANTTRADVELVFEDSVPMGTKVWVAAFWYNRRAESGPACSPVSLHLGFGAMSQATMSSQQQAA